MLDQWTTFQNLVPTLPTVHLSYWVPPGNEVLVVTIIGPDTTLSSFSFMHNLSDPVFCVSQEPGNCHLGVHHILFSLQYVALTHACYHSWKSM